MSRLRPTSPRGDRRRSEIVHAAIECLINDGWAGLTHRRVGQRAGCNPALLQYYFGDLAGLRAEVARFASAELSWPLGDLAKSTKTIDELVDTCVQVLRATASQPDQVRLLVQVVVGAAYYPEVAAIVRADLTAAKAAFAQHLRTVDPSRDQPGADAAADLFFATADGVMLNALATPGEGVVRHTQQLRALVWATLATDDPSDRPGT